jgi:hypothetical protein
MLMRCRKRRFEEEEEKEHDNVIKRCKTNTTVADVSLTDVNVNVNVNVIGDGIVDGNVDGNVDWEEERFRVQEWSDWVRFVERCLPSEWPSVVTHLMTDYCRRPNAELLTVRQQLMGSIVKDFGLELRDASGEDLIATEDHILQLQLLRHNLTYQTVCHTLLDTPNLTSHSPCLSKWGRMQDELDDLRMMPFAVLLAATPPDERFPPEKKTDNNSSSSSSSSSGRGWTVGPHLPGSAENEHAARIFVVITPLRTRDFSSKLVSFSKDMRLEEIKKGEFARQQLACRQRRTEVENLLRIHAIRDEERPVVRPGQYRSLSWAADLYAQWLKDARMSWPTHYSTFSKLLKEYSIHLLPSSSALPIFDGCGWVNVGPSTTFDMLMQYLTSNHDRINVETIHCWQGYKLLDDVLREVTRVFFGKLRVSPRQVYWYERTPHVDTIIQSFRALIKHHSQLNSLIAFSPPSTPSGFAVEPSISFLILPPPPPPPPPHPSSSSSSSSISFVQYRLEDDTILIPAHFSSDDFEPLDFAKRISLLVPHMVKPSSSSSSF